MRGPCLYHSAGVGIAAEGARFSHGATGPSVPARSHEYYGTLRARGLGAQYPYLDSAVGA